MTLRRSVCVAGALCLLGACGGGSNDAASDTAAADSRAADTARAGSGSAMDTAAAPGRVPAFVSDTAGAGATPTDTAPAGDSATAIRSVYTSIEETACRLVEQDEETGATSSRCPGTAGYALLVHDFDARMTVDVVAPGNRTHRLRYSGVITSAFSSLGPRAEWRMRGNQPVALIVRVNAFEDPSVPDRATSYLAVAKITPREACVTDRIAPGATANEAARQAADGAASRPCMRDLGG